MPEAINIDREVLEQIAIENSEPEDFYELLDNMDTVTDDQLIELAGLNDKLNIQGKVNPEKAKIEVSADLESHFMIEQVGSRTFYSPVDNLEQVSFIEKGNTLSTVDSHPNIVHHMLQVAEDRGWESIKVDGSDSLVQETWLEAKLRGIEVEGYEPTSDDIRRMETELSDRQMARPQEYPLSINEEKNSYAQDLKTAMTTLSREEATSKHPELEDVYALQPAAAAFCRQQGGLTTDQENAFVSKVTDKAIDDLASGKDIPTFDVQNQKLANIDTAKKHEREIDFD